MKSAIVICAFNGKAQTWSEWFRQKKTQKKYLIAQIAALKVYAGYLSTGYKVVGKGIGVVQHIKRGDFNLHSDYFTSLSTVNSNIKHYKKVQDIISIQNDIIRCTASALSNNSNNQFSVSEKAYFKKVIENLIASCLQSLDELSRILSDGKYEMKDHERIRAIDKIYIDMLDKKTFASSFCNSISQLTLQRNADKNDVIVSKKINDLP